MEPDPIRPADGDGRGLSEAEVAQLRRVFLRPPDAQPPPATPRSQLTPRRLSASAHLEYASPEKQDTVIGKPVPAGPAVCLKNAWGDPIPYAVVTFTIEERDGEKGDPSVIGENDWQTTQVTDQDGRAAVPSWTLKRAGEYHVTARIGNLQKRFTARAAQAGA